MKKKTLFSMLGVALCSVGLTAQTYKLHDMTQQEFAQGGNQYFSFSEYRLASGAYSKLDLYTDSGRVNFVDVWNPERFGGVPIGEYTTSITPVADKFWYEPLTWSWMMKKSFVPLNFGVATSSNESFIYIARTSDEAYETYPTLTGTVALEFKAPADGYYKMTSTTLRMDSRILTNLPTYLMAKFRFRQNGEKQVDQAATIGFDYRYGDLLDDGNTELYSYEGVNPVNNNPIGPFESYKSRPIPHSFYIYLKQGDVVTAEADVSYMQGTPAFIDSADASYGARAAWGRTRWTQFDAEVITKEVAEAEENFVNPYDDAGGYVEKLQDFVADCGVFMETAEEGVGLGQYDKADIDAFNLLLEEYGTIANKPGLLSFTAKVYYNKLQKAFEEFKNKANTIDFSLPENRWLFQIPESSPLYEDFAKQFDQTAENSPWGFKTYTVSSGIYNAFTAFDENNKNQQGKLAYYDAAGDWFYIVKNGEIHPLTTKSPVITFKAAADGIYHASTTIQRNTGNKNKNYMYTRYRFVKDGIEDGVTSVDKETFMFADAYGHADNNIPVSRDFYVKMKAGDVITFEEDAYTANTNGSGGSTWEKLMVVKVPADQEQTTIEANKDSYFDAYAVASDFSKLDLAISEVEENLSKVQVTDNPDEIGKYPSIAKLEVEDVLSEAKEIDRGNITQLAVDKLARDLSAVYAKFLTTLQVRYENEATLPSGPYYITKDGMVLTTDTYWASGNDQMPMFAHLQPLAEPTGVKNNQVFDIQFNAEAGNEDPLRYTLHCVLKDETWTDNPAYHITEHGQVREGEKSIVQSTERGNNVWRNHSLIYDGTNWCIYNVYNKTSLVFDADLTKKPVMDANKLYLYKLVPMDKIEDWRSIENVNATVTTAQIIAVATEGGADLYGTEEMKATVYNAAGESVMNVQLGTSATKVNLPAGFYLVKAVNGSIAKMMVK